MKKKLTDSCDIFGKDKNHDAFAREKNDRSKTRENKKSRSISRLSSNLETVGKEKRASPNISSTSIHRSKIVSSPNTITSGLDYFSELRAAGPSHYNPPDKAVIHAAQYLSLDPLEKMRRQTEQTLEAKLGLLQTKLDNARDPKNKTQRKIYIGNLTSTVNGEFLKQLFTQTLAMGYPQWNLQNQDFVVDVQYRDGNKYCFLEFRTMEMATAALQVNGVSVFGTQIHVSRSIGFLDPMECERAVKEVELDLTKFRSGDDQGPLQRQSGFTELIAKIKANYLIPNDDTAMLSSFLCFNSLVTPASLDSNEEVQELYEDIKIKSSEYGKIVRVVIPRPPVGVSGLDVFGRSQYGKAFVQFDKITAAENARKALNGIIFDGRRVTVKSVSEMIFIRALGI